MCQRRDRRRRLRRRVRTDPGLQHAGNLNAKTPKKLEIMLAKLRSLADRGRSGEYGVRARSRAASALTSASDSVLAASRAPWGAKVRAKTRAIAAVK